MFAGVLIERARERGAEAGEVRAAVALGDVVGEAQRVLVIAVVPLHREFDRDSVLLGHHRHGRAVQRLFGAVEVFDERFDAAFVVQVDGFGIGVARVTEVEEDTRIEEREFAQAMLERGVVEEGLCEGFLRGQEFYFRGGLELSGAFAFGDPRGFAHFAQRRFSVAVLEAHQIFFSAAPDAQIENGRERVHHRDADAVQAAGDLVGVLVEFSARVQLGHDDLGRRDAFFLMDVDRDAAAVVAHGDAAVAMQNHFDAVAMAGERFIDRVIDDFVDHVVQARAVTGIADVHAGAFAHGIKALEHLDGLGVIGPLGGRNVIDFEGLSGAAGRWIHVCS